MKNLLLLLFISSVFLTCKGVGGDSTGTVKGGTVKDGAVKDGAVKDGAAKVDTVCRADADCVLSTSTYSCCADCGTTPEEYIAIHVNEKKGRFAKEQAECDKVRKDCPLVNCPVLKFCNTPTPVCTAGKCTAKLIPIPDCTEIRYDKPAKNGG
ncbi:hypothetical protein KJ612_10485 [Myxococcota bacterium]|nr:hypothetical protein [Myxococcota bacterium]